VRAVHEVEDEASGGGVELYGRCHDDFAKLPRAAIVRLGLQKLAAVNAALCLERCVDPVGKFVTDTQQDVQVVVLSLASES
jgi:hypothetical protein